MNLPQITIGITCFNAEESIGSAVSSALAQNWENTEIVIYDDFSTDRSREILTELKSKHPQIRTLFSDTNNGVAHARNTLINEAKGEFLAFFDDDDVSRPDRIREQYQQILRHESSFPSATYVVSHTARLQTYPNGDTKVETAFSATPTTLGIEGREIALSILGGRSHDSLFGAAATCSQMARVAFYRTLGGFDEKLRRCEDTDLAIRAALNGCHFAAVQEPLVLQTMTVAADKAISGELNYNLILLEKHKDLVVRNRSFKFYSFCVKWLELKHEFLIGNKGKFRRKLIQLLLKHPIPTLRRISLGWKNKTANEKNRDMHNGR